MKKLGIYIVFLFATVFVVSVVFYKEIGFYMVFGFDHLFDPEPEKIDITEGKNISFELSIEKSCGYEIGIGFRSKNNEYKQIRNTFGDKATKLNFPASLDIKIMNSEQEIVFEKINFGGKNLTYSYGPSPIRFIAGHSYLSPGKYSVDVGIKKLEKDLSTLDSYFFAEINPKITCKKVRN